MGPEYWIGGAALVGVLAACWQNLKMWARRLLSLFVVRARLEGIAGSALMAYCRKHMRRSPFGDWRVISVNEHVRPVNRRLDVAFEDVSDEPMVFWRGWKPFIVSRFTGDSTKPLGGNQPAVNLTMLRGTLNIEQLVIAAMTEANAQLGMKNELKRYGVERMFGRGRAQKGDQNHTELPSGQAKNELSYLVGLRPLGWKREDIGADAGDGDPWQGLSFPGDLGRFFAQVKRWLASETWYREKRIPWRYGALFRGRPGTGKTSSIRAMARSLDLPIVAFDLATFSNDEFVTRWLNLQSRVPCIALFEDIDRIFAGRDNRLGEEGGGLTFDCFINCLSGIETADGVLTLVTTNRPDEIDEALGVADAEGRSSRPGRIDVIVDFPELTANNRREIATFILADCPQHIETTISDGDGETGAQFQHRCAQIALAEYWSSQCNASIPLRVWDESHDYEEVVHA